MFCLINTTLKLALHYPNNPEASVSDFYHERKVSDSHQDIEANTYQLPLPHRLNLPAAQKSAPVQTLKNPHRGALQQGHSPTVKYSHAERQLKNLAHSKLMHSLKTSADPGVVPSPGSAVR